MSGIEIGIVLVKIALMAFVVLTAVAYLTYAERRVSAFIQDRIGPNRVGPFGLLQPLADGVKFIFKEDIIPANTSKVLFVIAPAFTFVTALAALAVIPIGQGFDTNLFGLVGEPLTTFSSRREILTTARRLRRLSTAPPNVRASRAPGAPCR